MAWTGHLCHAALFIQKKAPIIDTKSCRRSYFLKLWHFWFLFCLKSYFISRDTDFFLGLNEKNIYIYVCTCICTTEFYPKTPSPSSFWCEKIINRYHNNVGITGNVINYLQPITMHAINHVGVTQSDSSCRQEAGWSVCHRDTWKSPLNLTEWNPVGGIFANFCRRTHSCVQYVQEVFHSWYVCNATRVFHNGFS